MTETNPPVLITGATGFLGCWITKALVEQGTPVIATDIGHDTTRLAKILPDFPASLVDQRICDVTDAGAVDDLVAETQPSAVVHLAALQIPQCRANPAAGAMVNIIGHINMFEAARKHGITRLIYTSSIAAKPRGPENAPANLYGVFKKTDEEIARLYWADHGIASLGLRPHIVYGVGRDEGETSAITRAIEAAALGHEYDLPFRTRSCFQYAGEVADIFRRATSADWQGAQLSDLTDRVESTDDVLVAIRDNVPGASITMSMQERLSPVDGFDIAPLRQVIGDWPAIGLRDGVRESVEMFRHQVG